MIVRLKRIYSFWIEFLALIIIAFFTYEFLTDILINILGDKASMICYMCLRPILGIIILLYFIFRNIDKGYSILQMLFGIRFLCNDKRQLILKNIIDLITLPITLITILIKNNSVGDYVCKVKVSEIENVSKKNGNSFLYITAIWFTVTPVIFCLAFNWRVNKSEQESVFRLNNTQTIKDNIGCIKSFSFSDKLFWIQYDKEGQYIGAKIKNEEGQKFKIKVYYNKDGNRFAYFIIDGVKYDYEIEKFDLNDYAEIVQYFDESIQVDKIENEVDALKVAADAYNIKFSRKVSGYQGAEVFYDEETDVYMVHYVSSTNNYVLGGDCNVIITSDGQVLAIWLGK